MHATRTPNKLPRGGADTPLLERLEWVESTASTHRAAAARMAGAHSESERRAAAQELAIAREMHRAALAKLAVDFGKRTRTP